MALKSFDFVSSYLHTFASFLDGKLSSVESARDDSLCSSGIQRWPESKPCSLTARVLALLRKLYL